MSNISDISDAIYKTEEGVVINIIVRPQSKNSGITGFNSWRKTLELQVQSPPSHGKANKEVIEIIANFFQLKKSDVVIISGLKLTQKKILIKSIQINDIKTLLEDALK
ncbi:MAG: YggU family protein [Thermoplasmata archaeon]|nr:MAG: YggU family protein [Thermoplasmata archaeon]